MDYKTLHDEQEVESVDYILDLLGQHCIPRQNINLKRTEENLKKLLKPCQFGDQEEKLLKALIFLGINSREQQERLLREDLSLVKIVNFCKSSELAGKHMDNCISRSKF
jgi:hypothetical protein